MSAPTAVTGARPASRWALLGAFSLLVATTQVLWLTFAPVTGESARALGVSEGLVGDLAVVNPLLFVVLALPAGRFVDRALHPTLSAGALLTVAGALVRLVDTSSYGWQLGGQLLASVAQPLVLTATTTLAVRAFPPRERTVAIAVGSAAQFVGVLGGALGGAPLVAVGGLPLLLGVHAVLAGVAAVGVLVMLRVAALAPVAHRDAHGLRWLRHEPLLWRLAGLLFVGVGVFNALATWLDPVLAALGHPGTGGPLIAVTTLAGVLGAAVLPGPVAARGARRRLLVAATACTGLVFAALVVVHTPVAAGVLLAVLGFLLLAGLPVALEWSEAHVGVARSGTATAVLLLAGNLGGVLLVLAVQPVVGSPRLALGVIALAAVPGLALALTLPRREDPA
ncbi:MFS transporter [Phycicoccus sonneratiae]|uniref:MFS transporter n=1 Tax=Phycicoccus sonneratiae TaxID=2807628 RepID=A0ABS2CPQ4_9MICO|nr:MFS transporter [Phycicoccus sonneraticus]MBM6401864.1 MFS transporter [Phycicoccus sonneraticus]